THGAMPWLGADPVVASAHVIVGLQTVVSRQVDTVREPAIVTIAAIHGGLRQNIIPDSVHMFGTIRTFNEELRDEVHQRVEDTAENIARGCRCEADVRIKRQYPVTVNHDGLTAWAAPRLKRVAGERAILVPKITGSEDFSYFQQRIPGFFYFVGITPADQNPAHAPANHSPRFYVDEPASRRRCARSRASRQATSRRPCRLTFTTRRRGRRRGRYRSAWPSDRSAGDPCRSA